MKSRLLSLATVLGVLLLTGVLTMQVGRRAWGELRADTPVLAAADLEAAAGEGIMVGLLGGFRAVTADLLWVRTNALWEQQDLPGTQAMIRLVTTVDTRPLLFWITGARIIGYDMPVWRVDALAAAQGAAVPVVVQQRITAEQVEAALGVRARARVYHPTEAQLVIEMAALRHRKLGDLAGAAELYREAALMPGAPYYAARIYGELLKQQGRRREAYAWLVQVHRQLPPDDPMAMADIVLGRIRELEEQLAVPPSERYLPSSAGVTPDN